MQFHLNGYEAGDPSVLHDGRIAPKKPLAPLPAEVDVLIVGCGPAGLTLAAQMSAFADINTCIVEQKDGPLLRGQADGVACRTVEMFEAFSFAERVLKEAYWVNETAFWKPNDQRRDEIVRGGKVLDTEEGLSEFPHVILNQARVHDFFLQVMRDSPRKLEPYYSRRLLGLTVGKPGTPHPVTVRFQHADDPNGAVETVRAHYVVGCDGARSTVRREIGRDLHGDSANKAWGVMDVLAVTDFPDIRLKALIQSAGEGSIILIPREGGYMVRIYVELDALKENERAASRNIGVEHLIAAVQRIFRPYSFDVKEVAWWSVYDIGQRLTDKFDDVPEAEVARRQPHVFIAGDACHTHSPKAGQGMNVSMQDSFNLGWKLAAVLGKRSAPSLLHTYSAERQAIAKELIDFDREWAAMLSSMKTAKDMDSEEVARKTQQYFVRHGHYTAGTATRYSPALLTGEAAHQHLAKGLVIGKRFHSAPVIRLADAKPMQIGHTVKADGRWRLFMFGDANDPTASGSAVWSLCEFLATSNQSPVKTHTRAGENIDSVIDVRAVFQQGHRDLAVERMHSLLLPPKGRYGLRDYEKMFCVDPRDDIFAMREIDRRHGCVVIVRPDQYVANILPLEATTEITAFFARFMV